MHAWSLPYDSGLPPTRPWFFFKQAANDRVFPMIRYGNKVLQYAIELTEETSKQGATLRRALLEMHVGRAIRPYDRQQYGCVF